MGKGHTENKINLLVQAKHNSCRSGIFKPVCMDPKAAMAGSIFLYEKFTLNFFFFINEYMTRLVSGFLYLLEVQ